MKLAQYRKFSRAAILVMVLALVGVITRVYGSSPFGGDDGGFVPPDKNTAKCEDAVAKNLARFLSCVLMCHVKAADKGLAAKTFDEEACEDGPTVKGTSCMEKYNKASTKLLSKNICPPCLDAGALASLTTQGEGLLEGLNSTIYCGGAPTATPTSEATDTATPAAPTPTPTCGAGQIVCGGSCTDVNTDVNNCGGCGTVCSPSNNTPACTGGICNGPCNAGYLDCNGNKQADGCEVAINSDANNCGGCGSVCSSNHDTPMCTGGNCTSPCDSGFADCNGNKQADGCEVSINSDANNCGACGAVCSNNNMATRTCTGGNCSGTCTAGFADCNANKQSDGCEVSVGSDANNCGACGAVCSSNNMATRTCTGGNCSGTCTAGFADCNNNRQIDGCETSVNTDANNCGGCGAICSNNHMATRTCTFGSCSGSCAAGFLDCDGNKQTDGCEINTTNDVNNCGACGNSCATGTCGAMGQACCAGNTCAATLTCSSGTCTGLCGSSGQACCAGNTCGGGLNCVFTCSSSTCTLGGTCQ